MLCYGRESGVLSEDGTVYTRMKPRQKANWLERESSSDSDDEVIGRTCRRNGRLRKGKGQSSRYAQRTSEREKSSSPVCVITGVSHAQMESESEQSSSSLYERGSSDSSNEEPKLLSVRGCSPTHPAPVGDQSCDDVIVVSESDYTSNSSDESCSGSSSGAEETNASRTGAHEDRNRTGGDWSGDRGEDDDLNRSGGENGGWNRDGGENSDWNRENNRNGAENHDWDGEEWNRDEGGGWNGDRFGGEEWNGDGFENKEWNRDEHDYLPLGDQGDRVDWENWEEREVVSPSLLTTPHQPAPNSCQPDPKGLRMTNSTARLKGFLPPGIVSRVSPTFPATVASSSPSSSRAPLANSGHPSAGTSHTAINRLPALSQPMHAGMIC